MLRVVSCLDSERTNAAGYANGTQNCRMTDIVLECVFNKMGITYHDWNENPLWGKATVKLGKVLNNTTAGSAEVITPREDCLLVHPTESW